MVVKFDRLDEIADLIGRIRHVKGDRPCDRYGIQCRFGHISQSCTSKLSATARSSVASFLLSACEG